MLSLDKFARYVWLGGCFLSLCFSRLSDFTGQFPAKYVVEQHIWHWRGSLSSPIGLCLIGYLVVRKSHDCYGYYKFPQWLFDLLLCFHTTWVSYSLIDVNNDSCFGGTKATGCAPWVWLLEIDELQDFLVCIYHLNILY